jgi:hypothetical protein
LREREVDGVDGFFLLLSVLVGVVVVVLLPDLSFKLMEPPGVMQMAFHKRLIPRLTFSQGPCSHKSCRRDSRRGERR